MAARSSVPILYPTHFNKYLQCPERYHREYQLKQRGPEEFNRPMVRGIAIHEILALAANEYRLRNGVPANLYELAERKLSRSSYPDEATWTADVDQVVQASKVGISYLDGESEVLAAEVTMHYPHRPASGGIAFILAAKTDLVLLKKADDGSEFLDVVDYKSASTVRQDLIQEVAARITVKQNASKRFGVADLTIVNTTIYLGAESVVSREITTDECRETWESMKSIARAIVKENQFPPTPSPLCEWCPFFEKDCSIYSVKVDDLQLAMWLDGAAV